MRITIAPQHKKEIERSINILEEVSKAVSPTYFNRNDVPSLEGTTLTVTAKGLDYLYWVILITQKGVAS